MVSKKTSRSGIRLAVGNPQQTDDQTDLRRQSLTDTSCAFTLAQSKTQEFAADVKQNNAEGVAKHNTCATPRQGICWQMHPAKLIRAGIACSAKTAGLARGLLCRWDLVRSNFSKETPHEIHDPCLPVFLGNRLH